MSGTVVDDILAYECTVGTQKAGSLSATALAAIASLAPRPLLLSVETGCGKINRIVIQSQRAAPVLHLGRYCLVSARRYGSQSHVHPALSFIPSGAYPFCHWPDATNCAQVQVRPADRPRTNRRPAWVSISRYGVLSPVPAPAAGSTSYY